MCKSMRAPAAWPALHKSDAMLFVGLAKNCRGQTAEEKARGTQLRCEALRLLPPFLGLAQAQARRLLHALGEIATDLFPVSSRELQAGSTQARACPDLRTGRSITSYNCNQAVPFLERQDLRALRVQLLQALHTCP